MNLKKKKGVCLYDIHENDFFRGGEIMDKKELKRKNKKGQIGVGMIILVAVTLIVGVIFFQSIMQQIGTSVNTVSVTNSTQTLAAEGSSIYLTTYRALSDVVVTNATGGETVPSTSYTVVNNVVRNGALTVRIDTIKSDYASKSVNISATAQPLTYIPNSGGRAVASLIGIMFALAIVIVAISPTLRSGLLDMFNR